MTPTPAGKALLAMFDRVVVINLAHRADRRRQVAAQFARLGLDFDDPQLAWFRACSFDDAAGFPTRGTRGCFHSHMGVWREAAARGDGSVLLIEDDLDFVPDIERRLPEALAALRDRDWSIFYGGVLQWTPALPARPPLSPAAPDEPIMGGHCVAVRGDAIGALAHYLAPIPERPAGSPEGGPMHVDGAYGWFRAAHPRLETWVATPDLGIQRSSRTDIHALRWKDRVPGVRELTALARTVRGALR